MPILEQVKWGEGRKRAFEAYAHEEIVNTMGNRAGLERTWKEQIEQWRAKQPTGTKEFPWIGASNLEFPLTAIHSDPVYADMMQTLHTPQEYWSVTANRADREPHSHPMTEFLRRIESSYLHMRQVNGRAFLDQNILGTAIYKNHWLHERKSVRDYNQIGEVEKLVKIRSHPLIEHVPLHYFWIPAEAWNIDPDAPVGGARWVAQELWLTHAELAMRAKAETPFLPAYDKDATAKVLTFEMDKHNEIDAKINEQNGTQPFRDKRIRLFELWARFDTDGDGVEEDVVAIFHMETGMALRVLHNPFLHGRRPFHKTRYLPTFGFYGLGLAEADEWAQLTATKLLNAQIDNILLANTRMFGVPLGYTGSTDVFPGKTWYVGPNEQIQEVRLGEVYPSIFNIQGQIMQWSEMRTGVNEIRQGNISELPSRTPAHSFNSMMQESNKRFDMILADFRTVHGHIGRELVQNLAQYYKEDPVFWEQYCMQVLGPEEAMRVIEVFQMGVHELPETFGVEVTATSSIVNKEADKQRFATLAQMAQQILGQLIQVSQILMQAPPGTPIFETASAAYTSGVHLFEKILEKFDIQNTQEYVGKIKAVAAQLNAMGAPMPGMPPQMMSPTGMQPGMAPAPYAGVGMNPAMLGWEQLAAALGI